MTVTIKPKIIILSLNLKSLNILRLNISDRKRKGNQVKKRYFIIGSTRAKFIF
tara:strand:- start:551 stop:709 length:159 start_codon:yes stop_codon:yes gene_type:complete